MFVGFVFFHHLFDSIQLHEVNVRLDDVSINSFAGLETISILCFYFGNTTKIRHHTQSKLKTIRSKYLFLKIPPYFLLVYSLKIERQTPTILLQSLNMCIRRTVLECLNILTISCILPV